MTERLSPRMTGPLTFVVGTALALLPAVMLTKAPGAPNDFFETATRIQIALGCLIAGIGLAFWRQGWPWARTAASLLVCMAIATTLGAIFGKVDSFRIGAISGTFVRLSVLANVIWVVILFRVFTHLRQRELGSEFGREAQ